MSIFSKKDDDNFTSDSRLDSLKIENGIAYLPLEDQGDCPIEYPDPLKGARGYGLTDAKMEDFKVKYNV